MAAKGTTPLMEQYHRIRNSVPQDVILFFRLGDFYEVFFEDAKIAASILNVALTKRNGIPMCGVPHHAVQGYIGKLVKASKRVAIAEQTSEPKPGKIVDREVTQIISAGTISDLNLLDANRPNYLAGVYAADRKLGLAFIDHTTGEFKLTEFSDRESLEDELARVRPSELLYSDEQQKIFGDLPDSISYDSYAFLHDQAFHTLTEHFKVQSLDGFGCAEQQAAVAAAGGIFHYVKHQLHRSVGHLKRLDAYSVANYVQIDKPSQINLDLVESRGGRQHTLLKALDRTSTPMGGRKLREWILHPLRDLQILQARQELIAGLLEEPFLLSQLQESLKNVRDIERMVSRLSQGSGNARDLQSLSKSLLMVPNVKSHLEGLSELAPSMTSEVQPRLHPFTELVDMLEFALEEELPTSVKEGGIFKDGYSEELDEIRAASRKGKQWIADLQTREAERTGIKSLKVRYNNVFGYFIEITKSNLSLAPDDYVRKQTMTNAERFITPELKEMENKILGADERSRNFEYEEFLRIRDIALEELEAMQETADALACLDVLCSLAETARLFDYCSPVLSEDDQLVIKDGRHPVLDQNLAEEKFVPNDTFLEPKENRLLLITGPNMAGKSTYIRQVALITLMAQIGSFVPAKSAEIGLVDRIFTRVGASDDLSRGQSTFMVEMNETALILNNATNKSLVILDEIGRGTSTFDGLSIAWSVAEHLHDVIGARALFATHYHELTDLAKSRDGVKNYNVAVREWKDEVIFLRKIIEGTADKSYGIQVARLAGLPAEIIARAKAILSHLEENASRPADESPIAIAADPAESPSPKTASPRNEAPQKAKARSVTEKRPAARQEAARAEALDNADDLFGISLPNVSDEPEATEEEEFDGPFKDNPFKESKQKAKDASDPAQDSKPEKVSRKAPVSKPAQPKADGSEPAQDSKPEKVSRKAPVSKPAQPKADGTESDEASDTFEVTVDIFQPEESVTKPVEKETIETKAPKKKVAKTADSKPAAETPEIDDDVPWVTDSEDNAAPSKKAPKKTVAKKPTKLQEATEPKKKTAAKKAAKKPVNKKSAAKKTASKEAPKPSSTLPKKVTPQPPKKKKPVTEKVPAKKTAAKKIAQKEVAKKTPKEVIPKGDEPQMMLF